MCLQTPPAPPTPPRSIHLSPAPQYLRAAAAQAAAHQLNLVVSLVCLVSVKPFYKRGGGVEGGGLRVGVTGEGGGQKRVGVRGEVEVRAGGL